MTYCFPGLGRNSLTVVIYTWSFAEQTSQPKAFTMCALSQSFNSDTGLAKALKSYAMPLPFPISWLHLELHKREDFLQLVLAIDVVDLLNACTSYSSWVGVSRHEKLRTK